MAVVTALFACASCTGGGCSSGLRPSGALNMHGLDISGGYTRFVGEAPVGLLRGAAVGIRREDSGAAVGGAWETEGVCMETGVWRVWPVVSPRAK